ncbi:MAG: YHS domain-containing (seleno)protein [Vicinamibacterales bacterium]|nr:YHS domain-containing (seleno)protein [Vicinamibacterales bacterium]
MRKHLLWIPLAVVMAVAGATPAYAQSEAPKPGAQSAHALGGYCPVAYVAMNQAMKGNPAISSTHKGKTYLLANADAKKMFDAAPEKYVPAYDGICATGVAMGMKLESKPDLFVVHEGKAYLFSDAKAKAMFEQDKAGTIAKANANWPKVSAMK